MVRDDLRRPGQFDETLCQLARDAAAPLGFAPFGADTRAGHDAITLSAVCPCVMLTVPSRDGLCHHPDEWTDPDDLALGVAWLCGLLETLVTREA